MHLPNEGRLSGLITIKDIEKVIEFPNAAKDEHGRLLVAAAVGVTSDTFERANALLEAGVDATMFIFCCIWKFDHFLDIFDCDQSA